MIALVLAASLSPARAAQPPAFVDPARCRAAAAGDPVLYIEDVRGDRDLAQMAELFESLYHSPKRLPSRAYWDGEKLVLPRESGEPAILPPSFVESIQRHVQAAFQAHDADFLFLPDMGHSHFMIPQDLWDRVYDRYPVEKAGEMLGRLMKDPRLEVLYHTAERLKADGDDARARFRMEHRNVVGANDGSSALKILQNPDDPSNTFDMARAEALGYKWYAGFNISANQEGCFEVEAGGRLLRFDLSMVDLTGQSGGF